MVIPASACVGDAMDLAETRISIFAIGTGTLVCVLAAQRWQALRVSFRSLDVPSMVIGYLLYLSKSERGGRGRRRGLDLRGKENLEQIQNTSMYQRSD